MHKIDRKEKPIFQKYSEESVKTALKIDFKKKCYLCEEVTRHFEVEHFYPQKDFPHLQNDYENLFYSCQKCNKIKPKTINTSSEDEVLNSCDIAVENLISLKYNSKKCHVEILATSQKPDQKTINTVKLLKRIYNGENSKSSSCEDLKDDIGEKVENFYKVIDEYHRTKLKRVALKKIKEELEIDKSYSTFKLWIIRNDKKLKEVIA
ncbi:HNH endonuclease [Thiovulum sp. ES]|nr:HNH endonuclease [Thiovulum sp. ES]